MESERLRMATEIFQQANRTVPDKVDFIPDPPVIVSSANATVDYPLATIISTLPTGPLGNDTQDGRAVILYDLKTGSGVAMFLATMGVGKFLMMFSF